MIAPDKDVVMAIVRLKSDQGFQRITKWLSDSLVKQSIDNNGERDDILNRQTQGRNLELKEQLDYMRDAEAMLDNMKDPQKEKPAYKGGAFS